ncbi:MAG: hypothetical protein EXS46_01870 [Candidatus Taylorbacteria bacterium]|nr:hypothetical protein [Candidatus Taylorbacteria bacterium]
MENNDLGQNRNLSSHFIYSGVFLNEESRNKILQTFIPKFENIYADHLTIHFKPSEEQIKTLKLGDTVNLNVIGIAEDDRAQALIMQTDLSSNANPHITLSTRNDTKPVYSNELIEKSGFRKLDGSLTVTGVIGLFDGKQVVTKLSTFPIQKIILPTRAQPDTIVAIFVLKKFGKIRFPGIENSSVDVWQTVPDGETPDSLLSKGQLLIDLGGGQFDHHGKQTKTTATRLISEYLGVSESPSLQKLLEYTERDDFFGKGTISADPLDRAFGLSGLVAALNKNFSKRPAHVVEIVLPFIEAHFEEEVRRTEELPKEFEEKVLSGKAEIFFTKQRDKKLKVVIIDSENASMPGYLRSQVGGRFDVVAQWMPSGHVNILTRPTKHIDLRSLTAIIRTEELNLKGNTTNLDIRYLARTGRLPEILEWYYDQATNSIQNGGLNPKEIEKTKISRFSLRKLLEVGLSEALWNPMH